MAILLDAAASRVRLLSSPLLVISAFCSISLSAIAGDSATDTMDWVDESELTESQKSERLSGCCGAYIEPTRTDKQAQLSPEEAPTEAEADTSQMVTTDQGRVFTFNDNVVVTQGNRRLTADKAIVDEGKQTLDIEGGIVLREPGLLLKGEKAHLKQNDKTFDIEQADYVIHDAHIRGQAEHIVRKENLELIFKKTAYTLCPPGSNAWLLSASKITVNSDRTQGVARNVTLKIKDIPVFYLPYLRFPVGNQRQSGFLFPTVSFTDSGANLATPYYFNLAPHYDLLLTPNYLDGHGLLLEGEARHLSPYFATTAGFGYLSNDRGGNDEDLDDRIERGELTEAQARPFKGEDRWLVDVFQTGGQGRWSSTIDYAKVSDRNYFRDLDTTQTASAVNDIQLNQSAELRYRLDHWQATTRLQQYQLLIDGAVEPYQQLPITTLDGQFGGRNWQSTLKHEFIRFDHPDNDDTGSTRVTGDRLRIDYQFALNYRKEWGFFKPGIGIRHLTYRLDEDANDRSPRVTSPQASIDAGLFFERSGAFLSTPYLQTFEPRLFYLRNGYDDHSDFYAINQEGANLDFDTTDLNFGYGQLFRTSRFAGGDRLDDTDQLSIGITNRIINPATGGEWLNLSIGQIIYFDDRRVTLSGIPDEDNTSDIAARASALISDHWQLTSNVIFDDETDKVNQGNLALRYRDNQHTLANVDYRYFRQAESIGDISQVSASAIWPIVDNQWNLLASVSRDLERHRYVNTLAGIEYNDCCYRIRLAARRWLDNDLQAVVSNDQLEYDRGLFLELQLKGLGGIGRKLDEVFDESIEGYNEWNTPNL